MKESLTEFTCIHSAQYHIHNKTLVWMSAEEIDLYYPFYILRVIADDSRAATNDIFFNFD